MTLLTDTLDSLWKVVAVGLLLGAGLPALFALGIRSLAADSGSSGSTIAGRIGATVCFAIIIVAVAAGILFLTEDFLTSTFGIKVF